MVSSALLGVVAQRLVRTLCPHCKEEYTPSPNELQMLGLDPAKSGSLHLFRAHEGGCQFCNNKGYTGRMAIHEVMPVTNTIKRLINSNATVDTIRETAIQEGMITMDENLKQIVICGRTSVEEMVNIHSLKM
jgi:type IV pilus assembly protein PilB